MVETVPVRADNVVRVLQNYKPCAMRVFRNKVNLVFDREKKEILFEIPCTRNYYSKRVVYHQLNYQELGLAELIVPVAVLRTVDDWIEVLSVPEAEAIFWRYINHDFEPTDEVTILRQKYKTLSYEEIAQRMEITKVKVYRYLNKALSKILTYVNSDLPKHILALNPHKEGEYVADHQSS